MYKYVPRWNIQPPFGIKCITLRKFICLKKTFLEAVYQFTAGECSFHLHDLFSYIFSHCNLHTYFSDIQLQEVQKHTRFQQRIFYWHKAALLFSQYWKEKNNNFPLFKYPVYLSLSLIKKKITKTNCLMILLKAVVFVCVCLQNVRAKL